MNQISSTDKTEAELDQRLLELTALFEVSRSLTASLSLQSILENLLRIPMGHMLISKGIVLLQKGEEHEFYVEGIKGLPRQLIEKSLNITEPPHHSVLINEIKGNHLWCDFFKEFGIKLLVPLISNQGTVGIVGFGEKIGGKSYAEREIEFLNSLSNIAATAVANGLMVEEIQGINRMLDRKIQQLNTIFDISRELNTTLDQEKIGRLASFAIMGELLVNKCIILTKENNHLSVLLAKGMESMEINDLELSELAEPVILEENDRFTQYAQSGIAVLVPMRMHEQTKGIIALGPKISKCEFDDADLEFLKTLGNQTMAALENARLFEETLEKQRLEEELNLARSIQQKLLPDKLPQPASIQLAARNIPSKQVGGDYFDVIQVSDHGYAIAIADVSGKGAGAALLMSNLQASLHALVSSHLPIDTMMQKINNLIYHNTTLDKFITFFYAFLDVEKMSLTYCNAGHNPPYLVNRAKEISELDEGGLLLGMMPDADYNIATVSLQSGDAVVLFTDGITEALNLDDEEYGDERLISLLNTCHSENAEEILNQIFKDTYAFSGEAPQADDMTVVVVKFS